MSVPSIIVKQDIETDVQQFTNFLYRWSPEKQCLIIRAYPGLTDAVQQGEETGEKLIGNFVREQYRLHQAQIEILVADMTLQVRKDGARVLEVLGTIMEYSWPKNDSGYTVIPTLLPFSPFHQPVFFFSLERFLRTNASSVASNYGLTAVIAHEVSHFIFFDMLSQMSEEVRMKCDQTIKHFVKEILAPIIMNDSRINGIIHLTDYGGNPFLKHIMLRQGEREENIVVFFRAEYERQHANGISFKIFVSYLIETLFTVQQDLHKRLTLWDTHGSSLLKETGLKEKYCEPIEIKK
ncbi:hypothetical protein A2678_02350 [Candidatus Kaiserbacteria bacterium RIFCSPHIGHO2_01_FULL_53_31]|uniref:Uncharacterized protein n=1 Tax=Candidatus Kaiserbacteria bacterium RIFCSPHIGHO2_01_FULL_53_31 TaxID=1798481 RepID=A0A1F6CIW0_9BACT|nr:MAG: hypothetical protein A2678_02350 [Candidatus Kaiserbacteria bacterium RIFCSPHIGHO2_01_FULL_53_31]